MAKKKKQQADGPILTEAPTVEIAGETYELRRLGLRDVFRVARILGNGVAVIGNDQYSDEQVAQVLVASMSRNEEEVLALVADLMNVDREELDDPTKFPMDSIVVVIEALSNHPDMSSFLARVNALAKKAGTKTA